MGDLVARSVASPIHSNKLQLPHTVQIAHKSAAAAGDMGRSNLPKQMLPQEPAHLLERFENIARLAQSDELSGLLKRPSQRNLHTTEGGLATLKPTLVRHKIAALCQSRGYIATTECSPCEKYGGPFKECVLLDGRLGGICVNCYLNSGTPRASKCSYLTRERIHACDVRRQRLAATKNKKIDTRKIQAPSSLEHSETKWIQPSPWPPLQAQSTLDAFVLLGALALPALDSSGLHPKFVRLITENLPHIQTLDKRNFNNFPLDNVDLHDEFSNFKLEEEQAWTQSSCALEPGSVLLHPSGNLRATIAHRLHQPSFTTSLRSGTETADKSNGCIAMVMGNAYRENDTLLYDHLHRRSEKSEGLKTYPQDVVECHERFTQKILESSQAKVEVVYGKQVQARVLHSGLKVTAIPLWGDFANIVLYFIHEDNFKNQQPGHHFRKIMLFATHPQRMFYERRGSEISIRQDRTLEAAVRIANANIAFQPNYYQTKRWRECVPSANQLALDRAASHFEPFPFEDLPEIPHKPRGVEQVIEKRLNGMWDDIFSPEPHSNKTIQNLIDQAIRANEALSESNWIQSRGPAQLPPAVLIWLKGQKQVLFYNGPLHTEKDVAIILNRCKTSLSQPKRQEIESRFPGLGLLAMLGQFMLMQKMHLDSLNCQSLDYFHSRFDAIPVKTTCACGEFNSEDNRPRFSCMRVGSYICRLSKRCKSAECRGRLQSMRPTSRGQIWIHQSNMMSSKGRIHRDYSTVLQSLPHRLPTTVKLWCVWCKEKTQVEGNYSYYEDKKAEWTLGQTRPLYVERRPRCVRCFESHGREGRFVPTDPEIPSISRNRLEDFARQFADFDQGMKGFILDGWMPSSREPRSQVYEPSDDED